MPMTEDGYVPDTVWIPGVDFDPHDHDEMEIMHIVWEKERLDKMAQLERENDRLRMEFDKCRGEVN